MTVPGPIDIEDHPEDADARIGRFLMIQAIEKAYEDHSLSYQVSHTRSSTLFRSAAFILQENYPEPCIQI